MATKVAVVTEKNLWHLGNDRAKLFKLNGLHDPEEYADASAAWTTETDDLADPQRTVRLVVTPAEEFNVISWKFYGTDTADQVCTARFWAFADVDNNGGVMGDYMGDVVITLGSKEIHSGATVLPGGKLWAKRLQPTIDKTLFPGVRVIGEGGNAPATMIFDGMGLKSFIVEIALIGSGGDPAEDAGVLWRVF